MFTHKKGIQLCADEINRLEFAFSQDWISEENNVQPTLECVHVDRKWLEKAKADQQHWHAKKGKIV